MVSLSRVFEALGWGDLLMRGELRRAVCELAYPKVSSLSTRQ